MFRTAQGTLRFTRDEVGEFRSLGIDVSHVRKEGEFADAVRDWLDLIAEERPELFDKITQAIISRD